MNENLGKKGTDRITGLTGTIMGYVEYLTGCNQYLIVPKCKEGEENTKPTGHWLDDNRIDITGKSIKLIDKISNGPDISPQAE